MIEAGSIPSLRKSEMTTPCCDPPPAATTAEPSTSAATSPNMEPRRDRRDVQLIVSEIKEALHADPENPLLHLDLGRAYLASGRKHLALHAFRKGLKYGDHRGLNAEIRRLGFRRSPIFPFLGRKHPLNKFAGRLLCWLGWR